MHSPDALEQLIAERERQRPGFRAMVARARRDILARRFAANRSTLPKMAGTHEGRRESPYYRPAPFGDRRLREG